MPEERSEMVTPTAQEVDDILPLIARLPRNSPVRRLAVDLVRGVRPSTLQPFVASLNEPHARRWRERAVSAWALGRAAQSEDEKAAVAGTLMDELEGQHQEPLLARLLRGALITSGVIFAGMFLALILFGGPNNGDEFFVPIFIFHLFGLPIGIPSSFQVDNNGSDRVRAEAARGLGHLEAPDGIGALALALSDRSPLVRYAAAEALGRVLPLLTHADYGRFGAESIANLGKALYHKDNQLVFEVLEALDKVGTSQAVPFVERMARHGRTVRLRDAARDVLNTLYARQEREAHKDTLLRSSVADDQPSFLLRPARNGEMEDSQALLRSASSEEA
jgi:HEAT repeat protein